jgi:N-acetylglucosamine-6-sulfatase
MKRIAAMLALLSLSLGVTTPSRSDAIASTGDSRPNIVFILTDDQRWDSMFPDEQGHLQMQNVTHLLGDRGMTLSNYFLNVALCCPSRTTIMRGQYAQSTGVYNIDGYYGGYQAFHRNGDDLSNVATWLHDGGYRTGLIGKYLNGYDVPEARIVPPGWDVWNALTDVDYYNFSESVNGKLTRFAWPLYQTDVLRTQALAFIQEVPQDQPLFLYWAPHAPHFPAIPADPDLDACPWLKDYQPPPSFNEADVSDKPPAVQKPPMSRWNIDQISRFRLLQCRSLQDVDRSVGDIVNELDVQGRLANTLFIYSSDNGIMYGEHRIVMHKNVGYEEAIHSPFIARWDGVIPAGTTDDHLAGNVDLAPTLAEVAGVTPPYQPDGVSLLPILNGSGVSDWREAFLIEHGGGRDIVPPFCGVRTVASFTEGLEHGGVPFKYIWYFSTDGPNVELYDLQADQWEDDNLAGNSEYQSIVDLLQTWVAAACSPLPPLVDTPPGPPQD